MKKLIVLVLGMLLCASLFAVINITKTRVKVNGSLYDCKGDTLLFEARDLGTIGSLSLNGTLTNSGTSGASVAYMYYRLNGIDWMTLGLDHKTTASTPPAERGTIDPSGEGDNVSSRSLMKTLSDIDSFTRTTDLNVDLSGLTNGATYDFEVFHKILGVTEPIDTSVSVYTATFTKTADISFTDGSSFTPSAPTKGSAEQIIGRFWMSSDVSGATLTGASIDLEGTRTGFSNFKLWASTDDNLVVGEDEYIRTISTDPGASPLVYSSFSVTIPTSGSYFFLTADVEIEASGSIRAYIGETADLTVSDGIIGETIASAVLSASEVPTSICLSSFTAALNSGKVELTWTTASETENDHFLIYRDGEVIAQVEGSGTTTEQHSYTYLDTRVQGGIHEYAISDVTWGGIETVHAPVMIEIEEEIVLSDFVMNNAYPNPFNPRTVITMHYAVGSDAVVNIYNTQGVLVDQLINGFVDAGSHEIIWDAATMPSGVYLVTMQTGNTVQSQKIVLMK